MKPKEHQDMSIDELIDEVVCQSTIAKGIQKVIDEIMSDPNSEKGNVPILEKLRDEYLKKLNSAKAHLRDKRIDEILQDD